MDVAATAELAELRARVAELEQSLARRTREMVALHEISLEINRQPNLAALLQAIVEKAAGLLNARMGGLYLMLPDGETLELVVSHNLPQNLIGKQADQADFVFVEVSAAMIVRDIDHADDLVAPFERNTHDTAKRSALIDRGAAFPKTIIGHQQQLPRLSHAPR